MTDSISECLKKLNQSEHFCATSSTGWLDRSQYLGLLKSFDPLFPLCYKKHLAFKISDNFLLSQALTAFDGIAKSIVLIPSSFSEDSVSRILNITSSDLILKNSPHHPQHLFATALKKSDEEIVSPSSLKSAQDEFTQWIIPTSGTTSEPKLVSHTIVSLTDRVKLSSTSSHYTWGLIFDLNRFAGLQVFFQAAFGGSKIVFPSNVACLDTTLKDFVQYKVNALSASSTLWRKILMSPASEALSLTQVSLGGEIADQQILDALTLRFPDARISHIYASTEAGAGFAMSDKTEGFPASYLSDPPHGVKLKLDESGCLHIWKKFPASHYVASSDPIRAGDGYINTGDLVEVRGDRCVFLGRENGAINVGGNKVQPEEVERVIRELNEVSEVSVFAKKNTISGHLVAARIVLKPTSVALNILKSKIRQHCASQLESYKVPAFIEFTETLQISSAGKMIRKQDA